MGVCITSERWLMKNKNAAARPFVGASHSHEYDGQVDKTIVELNSVALVDPQMHTALPKNQLADAYEELRQTEHSVLFSAHPQLLFSNRAGVICTGVFLPGEVVGNYKVTKALSTGTVGRAFLVRRVLQSDTTLNNCSLGISGESKGDEYVFKVVTFITRMNQVNAVMEDQKILSNLNHKNVLSPVDVLDDGKHENLIFVTPYVKWKTSEMLAEKFKREEGVLRLLRDIAVGLRVLHSHKIYHHNLKMDNIFIKDDGSACVSDAGFWRLFSVQTPEGLLFNGELACMPPELFLTGGLSEVDHAKVDIWGLGVLMYRLAYNCEPFNVEGKTLEEVEKCILHGNVEFPVTKTYSTHFREVIRCCLEHDAKKRPTVMQLLRHSLFRTLPVQSRSSGVNSPPAQSTAMLQRAAQSILNLSCSSTGMAYSEFRWSNGLKVCRSLGCGRRCESFLVHQRCNPVKVFVVKVTKRSPMMILLWNKEDVDSIHSALAFCCKVRHPNLLNLISVVDGKDVVCATQAYVAWDFISTKFPPLTNPKDPLCTVKHMLADVLKGLYVLHMHGVPHLCLTPSNIFYQRGTGFVIADFGPVFCSRQEVLTGGESGLACYSVPLWVLADIREPMSSAKHCIDIFCVGLLAASSLPSIFEEVWDMLRMRDGKRLILQEVLDNVTGAVNILSPLLVDFIVSALTLKKSVLDLLSHPYLADVINIRELLEIKPLEITSRDVNNALRPTIYSHSGVDLVPFNGGKSTAEGARPNGRITMESKAGNDDSSISSGSSQLCNAQVLPPPTREKFTCGSCRVELNNVLFKCKTCLMYACCAKCLTTDKHAEGHKLEPYFVHADEPADGNSGKNILLSPKSIQNLRPLQELACIANVSSVASTKPFPQKEILSGYSTPEGCGRAMFMGKKKVLPKSTDIDDLSWEEEIKNCREVRSPELLLYHFDLKTVPREVFDPPLTHVVRVDLSNNKLKSIPHELSFLSLIRNLILANNELTELPDSLGDLSQLENLDVSHNKLQELPQTFAYLQQLDSISMDYNDFAEIPESLVELISSTRAKPMLSVVYMADNPRITRFPSYSILSMFASLKLALDNEPTVYRTYIRENLEAKLPNVTMVWNKIYPDPIIKNLYCGSLRTALSQAVYNKLSIMNVLTVCREIVALPPAGGRHLIINLDDIEGVDIRETFEEAVEFIHTSLTSGTGCLVHCFAGMSRSATTVIAYLMIKRGMRLDEAYCTTRRGRPCIFPNQGFFNQLKQLDAELFPNQRPLDFDRMKREKFPT